MCNKWSTRVFFVSFVPSLFDCLHIHRVLVSSLSALLTISFLPRPQSNIPIAQHPHIYQALQHYSKSLSLIPRNTFSVPTQHVSQPANLRGRTELRQHLLPNSSSIYLTPSDAWSRALEVCEVLPRAVQLADLPQPPAVLPYFQQ